MDLINELSNELALAFLVEKKYAEKVNTSDVLALIGKIKEVLQPLSAKKNYGEKLSGIEKTAHFGIH
ncbi:MAG: hypothetical protein H0W58_14160 [Acidobacteria bacterium]|jgi:hypothetical protein|nr:hypothetical protein [Acidobacteriota bacterium]